MWYTGEEWNVVSADDEARLQEKIDENKAEVRYGMTVQHPAPQS